MRESIILRMLKDFVLVHLSTLLTSKKDKKLPEEIFNTQKFYKISYCTTCMGRTFHLKKTYTKNILENLEYPNIEFILLNYNSKDDMDEWVSANLSQYIDKGIVKYYKTETPQQFHMSKAKNLAHRLASGDILVNLDADNYLGKNNAFYTNHMFKDDENVVLRFTKKSFKYFDTCGRIAVKMDDFRKIGGYREDLLPYGQEDIDFLTRAIMIGNKLIDVELVNFLRTIKHTHQLRKLNIDSSINIKKMKQKNSDLANQVENSNTPYLANSKGFAKFIVFENYNKNEFEV